MSDPNGTPASGGSRRVGARGVERSKLGTLQPPPFAMALYRLDTLTPTAGERSFIAPGAHVIGQVTLGADCSVG